MQASLQSSSPDTETHLLPGSNALLGNQALLALVQQVVDSLDWPQKDGTFALDEEQRFPNRLLMVLELYSCAKGAQSSENIADWTRDDPVLCPLFPAVRPLMETMRRFRRSFHQQINRALKHIFEVALKARFGEDKSDETPVDSCAVEALDSWFHPKCGARPEEEAKLALDTLVFVDGMLLT